MSTSIVTSTNIRHMPIINFAQNYCNDFMLVYTNIDNAEALFDGDINADKGSYVNKEHDIDCFASNQYCTHITDAQMDAQGAFSVYVDEDDATKNYVVLQPDSDQQTKYTNNFQRKAFCGLMGALASGYTNGTTVQNWSDAMKRMFDRLCRWIGTSDRRLR